MKAWELTRTGPVEEGPLSLIDRDVPEPGGGEIVVRVAACGVCRTDLHIVEGDLPVHRPHVIPGHEVVGTVDAVGPQADRFKVGDRVGIAWLRHTCGRCRFCIRGDENLCLTPEFTGWDADGGYAEYAAVNQDYAYSLPDGFDDEHAAPLLCAGIIGYRALKLAALPPGGVLGMFGFGASAHLAAQIALAEGAKIHAVARGERSRRLALDLGVASAGAELPPGVVLDSAILFAPAGALVPIALRALDRGGTLSIAGIHLDQVPALDYDHDMFYERRIVSVTANTRLDGREFLERAARIPVKVSTVPFDLVDAPQALTALSKGEIRGAAVLNVGRS
jgi:propanol-preferring alcohol dehydrogenase